MSIFRRLKRRKRSLGLNSNKSANLIVEQLEPRVLLSLFGPEQIISVDVNNAYDVHAADLDQDGDMDVLSASRDDDKIAWYRNDGSGNFSAQIVITTNANAADSVYAADLDQDGDMDVLSASGDDDKIAWYRNDGSGNFSAQIVITTNADGAYNVYAADLDNDGDMDVLSASALDDKIAWYRNDGAGNFSSQIVITASADGPSKVYAADLDQDGDLDVISASYDGKIAWYENLGGDGSEQLEITGITASLGQGRFLSGSDLPRVVNRFTAAVSGNASSVTFTLGNQAYTDIDGSDGWNTPSSGSDAFNMSIVPENTDLVVQAYGVAGSDTFTYDIDVLALPDWMGQDNVSYNDSNWDRAVAFDGNRYIFDHYCPVKLFRNFHKSNKLRML